jgi:predicted SprT family Zn-dependent metalloprotease
VNSDNVIRPQDTHWRQAGTGMYITFRCAACCKVKGCNGRKLKRVMGLRQYVCKECAK